MERWHAKLISLFVAFLLPYCATIAPHWVSPLILKRGRTGARVLCYMMCFGGGIFLGTFMLHMGPEVREILEETLLGPNGVHYPVADLIIGCGFFFVLYLEKIVMRVNKRRTQKKKKTEDCGETCGVTHRPDGQETHHGCRDWREGCMMGYANEGREDHNEIVLGSTTIVPVKEIDAETTTAVTETENSEKINGSVIKKKNQKNQSDEISLSSHDDDGSDHASHHNVRSLIMIIALSLHHIFEGLAIGLQPSVQSIVTLMIGVMCHEAIISFSLGLQFVKGGFSLKRMLITAFAYAIILPLGFAIGMVMSEVGSRSQALDLASGIVQAFASGTFLYVTFFEILQEEISSHDTSLGKVTGAVLGFAVMALLTLIPEDESGNEDEPQTTAVVMTTAFYLNATESGWTP